jgi:hypothetical protein
MIRSFSAIFGLAALAGLPFLAPQEPEASAPLCCATDALATEASAPRQASLASLPGSAAPHLDEIKKLVGDWYQVGDDGKPSEQLVSSYRVTAGGSAVIETLFPGEEHEMISMYFMDGGDLRLTHYCSLGNAPRFRAERSKNGLAWRCLGVHNLDSHRAAHMHEGHTDWHGADHITGTWLQTNDGEVTYTAAFELIRVSK